MHHRRNTVLHAHPPRERVNVLEHRHRFEKLADKLGIEKQQDWYKVAHTALREHKDILSLYQNSTREALKNVFPEYRWHEWLFHSCPKRFWTDLKNQREYFEWAEEQLGIESKDQWHKVTAMDLLKLNGHSIMTMYENSVFRALCCVFPEHTWNPWQFQSPPRRLWTESVQRRFFDWLAATLGIHQQEQFYALQIADIDNPHGRNLIIQTYHSSLHSALSTVYPEYTWYPWLFESCPKSFWNQISNRKQYFEWLAKELDIQFQEDWYRVSNAQIAAHGGHLLLLMHNHSLLKALKNTYPNYIWIEEIPTSFNWNVQRHSIQHVDINQHINTNQHIDTNRHSCTQQTSEQSKKDLLWIATDGTLHYYSRELLQALQPASSLEHKNWEVSRGYWSIGKNQRNFFDSIAKDLQIEVFEDWYRVKGGDILNRGGIGLLSQFNCSLIRALETVYPEFEWHPWLFDVCPRNFWHNIDNHRRFFDWFAENFGIEKPSDWYSFTVVDVCNAGGRRLLQRHYNLSLRRALQKLYPHTEWHPWLFAAGPKNFWLQGENVTAFMSWVAQRFDLVEYDDWNTISALQIRQLGGNSLLEHYGGLHNLLDSFFCQPLVHNGTTLLKSENRLVRVLQDLLESREFKIKKE